MSTVTTWWRGAVIYQIYPRSFADSNNDGLGDLKGIESKLDYVASLGVDAIWLSPIFRSPQADFGYDVSDYCDIEPTYGSLEDFDRLLAAAHARGLKLILDQILSHTSIEHPWFIESRSSRDNPKADWYVWADPKPDGTVPNNWLAAFGGPAWGYWPERRQYYHHKFYREQPKLNLHNSQCAAAVLKAAEFWLARGVDGFRLDVANSYFHDPELTDNPPIPASRRGGFEWGHPPRMQHHTQDANRPDNWKFLEALRGVVDRFPDRFIFGEISEEPERIGEYVDKKRLHSVYAFDYLEAASLTPKLVRDAYARSNKWPDFFPCNAFSNHDFLRVVTRWRAGQAMEQADEALAKQLLALLFSLRGTVLLYQGEELGLPEADIPYARVKDPVGRLYYPLTKGRDGCRTPMPWVGSANFAGFSACEPWLPVPDVHHTHSADRQLATRTSALNFARKLIELRKQHSALATGELSIIPAVECQLTDDLLLFVRSASGEKIVCAFNMSSIETSATLSGVPNLILASDGAEHISASTVKLPARGFVMARI